jgi:hypothetical protein
MDIDEEMEGLTLSGQEGKPRIIDQVTCLASCGNILPIFWLPVQVT